MAAFAYSFLCSLYVLAPLVEISQGGAILAGPADAVRIHRRCRARALSWKVFICNAVSWRGRCRSAKMPTKPR